MAWKSTTMMFNYSNQSIVGSYIAISAITLDKLLTYILKWRPWAGQPFAWSWGEEVGSNSSAVYRLLKQVGTNQRDKRGCPLPTVETEANGDSWSTYEMGPFLVGSYKIFLSCLGCSSQPRTIFFLHRTLFQFISPNRWSGSRAASPVS